MAIVDLLLDLGLVLVEEGEYIFAGGLVCDSEFDSFLLVVDADDLLLVGVALLLDALDALEVVSAVLTEDGALGAELLQVHQADDVHGFLVDQAHVGLGLLLGLLLRTDLFDLVEDVLFGLVAAGVLPEGDLGDFEGLVLEGGGVAFGVDDLDELDVLGELRDVVGLEEEVLPVLGTGDFVLSFLHLAQHRVQAVLAECVPAG